MSLCIAIEVFLVYDRDVYIADAGCMRLPSYQTLQYQTENVLQTALICFGETHRVDMFYNKHHILIYSRSSTSMTTRIGE